MNKTKMIASSMRVAMGIRGMGLKVLETGNPPTDRRKAPQYTDSRSNGLVR